jgi:hypothetical protein
LSAILWWHDIFAKTKICVKKWKRYVHCNPSWPLVIFYSQLRRIAALTSAAPAPGRARWACVFLRPSTRRHRNRKHPPPPFSRVSNLAGPVRASEGLTEASCRVQKTRSACVLWIFTTRQFLANVKCYFLSSFLPREEILDIVKNLQVKILIFFNGGTLQRPRIYGGWKQKSCDVFLTWFGGENKGAGLMGIIARTERQHVGTTARTEHFHEGTTARTERFADRGSVCVFLTERKSRHCYHSSNLYSILCMQLWSIFKIRIYMNTVYLVYIRKKYTHTCTWRCVFSVTRKKMWAAYWNLRKYCICIKKTSKKSLRDRQLGNWLLGTPLW